MKSDLVHSRVQDGPEVRLPLGNHENMGADVRNFKTAHTRTGLEKDILERLVTEVAETVATEVNIPNRKQAPAFGALSLWNLRRRSRSARNAIKQPRIVTGIGY